MYLKLVNIISMSCPINVYIYIYIYIYLYIYIHYCCFDIHALCRIVHHQDACNHIFLTVQVTVSNFLFFYLSRKLSVV